MDRIQDLSLSSGQGLCGASPVQLITSPLRPLQAPRVGAMPSPGEPRLPLAPSPLPQPSAGVVMKTGFLCRPGGLISVAVLSFILPEV